ncbi:unnamed protein product [Orchesella dallaii]|uniref:Myosin motor domain-containing protein n=1 Tax=Orchesella dallaii TaxID=48710 RepID=A0ABP1QJS7_9HEXA
MASGSGDRRSSQYSATSVSKREDTDDDTFYSNSSNSEITPPTPPYGSSASLRILKNSNKSNISKKVRGDTANQYQSDKIESDWNQERKTGTTGEVAEVNLNLVNANQLKNVDELHTIKTQRSIPPMKLAEFREIHDLTKLDRITMENVLECLKERYRSHQYYTYAGPVLLCINSCLNIPRASLVEDLSRMSWFFFGDSHSGTLGKENETDLKSPHVYDVGRQCLRNLVTVGSHQIILISGESGAGKTTATQQLIKYLTENNSRNFGANICSNLDKRIYFATIVLESFGNAKTQANPNSSRFGRLVQLNYDKDSGRITGAEIQTYLLEKHRVAKYDFQCERTFHIFYYILRGLKSGSLVLPRLSNKNYSWKAIKELVPEHLVVQALQCEEDEINRLLSSVQAFNMSNDFSEIASVLFAMMALLRVTFVPDCDSSSEEEFTNELESPYKTEYTVSDMNCTKLAATLLGIKDIELVDVLIARKITAGSSHRHSIFRKPCERASECEERLHALTSFVYERLFSFILEHLNSNLKLDMLVNLQGSEDFRTLSLLDLYGFENFKVNHLEQICINYANERLQQINISIVKSYYEQSVLPDEIMIPPTELIRIEDELNRRIEELHVNVFAFVDEECLLKRSVEDKDILERMSLATQKSQFISTVKPKRSEQEYKFTIRHYATTVDYQLSGIVQKNKDHIPPEFQDILRTSSNPFINDLFKHNLVRSRNVSGASGRNVFTVTNKNPRGKTILTRFKASVEDLLTRIKSSENKDVHFIRCIRPNTDLTAASFCTDIVEKQLHACGIADVVRIAGNGFPIRISTTKFLTEFPKVIGYFCNGILNHNVLALIFSGPKVVSLKFGKTMIFMSEQCWKKIKKTEVYLATRSTKIIQRYWSSHVQRQELLRRASTQSLISNALGNSYMPTDLSPSMEIDGTRASLGSSVDGRVNSSIDDASPTDHCTVTFASKIRCLTYVGSSRPTPPLYYGNRKDICSRAPVHTLPIKFYTKKTCIPFAGKPPRRLLANGIQDAFEDYGINFLQMS